jgi:hypothetical protein
MRHYQDVLQVPVMEVCYEDLVTDQENQVKQMLDYFHLSWEEKCLRPDQAERVVLTASFKQVRKPIYKSSIARWKGYEKYLGPLIDALGDLATP